MDYFLKCYIDYNDGTKDIIDIDKVKKEDYAKVIKLRFWRLKSYQLETEAPQVYEMENLGHLETPDTEGDAIYSDKLGNLINLHTLKVGHIGTCNINNNSKCFTYKNRGLIKNYEIDTYISPDIEYLNLFLGWFNDDYNYDKNVITLLNNLHNGLKYLQINISDFDILKYINNLPITLEILKIVITHCPKMIFYEGEQNGEKKYYKEANYALEQIKTPFGCRKILTILNLTS